MYSAISCILLCYSYKLMVISVHLKYIRHIYLYIFKVVMKRKKYMNSLPLKYQSDIVLTFYFQSYFYHYYLNDIQTSLFIFIPYYFSSTYINQYMPNHICCSGSGCIHLQIWTFSSKLKTDKENRFF